MYWWFFGRIEGAIALRLTKENPRGAGSLRVIGAVGN
jgi:hypothetical protein